LVWSREFAGSIFRTEAFSSDIWIRKPQRTQRAQS